MAKEINRYTLNVLVDGKAIAVAQTNLENIDRLSSNFDDKFEMLNFIEEVTGIDFLGDDISVTYHANKRTIALDLIYSSSRDVVDSKSLRDEIIKFLESYEKANGLNLDNLNNSYLRGLIYDMLSERYRDGYNFRLGIIKDRIKNEYKLRRDLSLFLDKEMKRRKSSFLNKPEKFEKDQDEIHECLAYMVFNRNVRLKAIPVVLDELPNEEPLYGDTGDEFLDYLLQNKDYEAISNHYSNEELISLGVRIFDGAKEVDKNGRSR